MATINTILGSDTITSSRTVINQNFTNLNTDKIETSVLDTDTALTANSDLKVATQRAVKAYVDTGGSASFINSLIPTGIFLPYGGTTPPTNWLLCDGSARSRATFATLFAVIGTSYGVGDGATTFNIPDMRARMPIGAGAGTFTLNFTSTDVVVATDTITVPTNTSLYDGTLIRLTTTGTLPTGLALGTDYFVIRVSATTIRLATTQANALATTPVVIDITAQGSGTHTATVTLTDRVIGARGGEEQRSLSVAEMPIHSHSADYTSSPDNNQTANASSSSTASTRYTQTGLTGGNTPHNVMNPFVVINYIIKT